MTRRFDASLGSALWLLMAAACSPARPPVASRAASELTAHHDEPGEVACCSGESEHGGGSSCGAEGHAQPALATPGALRLLPDASTVCMVRNHFMGRPQIPVVVDGHTYYGCCEGCKQRLLHDPNARAAIDPVTSNPVDKAQAVVAVDERGGLLYFENEANFRTYAHDTHQRVD
jgi:YHS domain-containing protein